MGLSKRKSIAVLAAFLFFIFTALAYAGQFSVDSGEKSLFSTPNSLTNFQQNAGTTDDNLSSALHRMMVAVLIIVALGVAAIYGSKKILPKLVHVQGKKIKVVETVHLGARKTVHLIEIGGQQILVGSTHDRLTKLADIFSEKGFPLSQTDKSEGAE